MNIEQVAIKSLLTRRGIKAWQWYKLYQLRFLNSVKGEQEFATSIEIQYIINIPTDLNGIIDQDGAVQIPSPVLNFLHELLTLLPVRLIKLIHDGIADNLEDLSEMVPGSPFVIGSEADVDCVFGELLIAGGEELSHRGHLGEDLLV